MPSAIISFFDYICSKIPGGFTPTDFPLLVCILGLLGIVGMLFKHMSETDKKLSMLLKHMSEIDKKLRFSHHK